MRPLILRTLAAVAGLLLSAAVHAAPSRADAQAQVGAAVDHVKKVGVEQAIKDFNSAPEWKNRGMNVILDDMKGTVLASSLNPRLVGKQTYEIKDPSGKEFVKEFISVASQKGEGWIDYQFVNPETKALEERSMFVRKVAGFEGFVGVAITK
ncbi:MAG TPA: cache domain-containing protein [Burkholderiaceae bacterium]|nr:cache domain-containing protein [Burkholderiaceae bacterium]